MKPPKGWRWLRKGTVIQDGDMYWSRACKEFHVSASAGDEVGDSIYISSGEEIPYIRRIKRKNRKVGK